MDLDRFGLMRQQVMAHKFLGTDAPRKTLRVRPRHHRLDMQCAQTSHAQILVQRTRSTVTDHINRPCDRIRRDRRAAGERLQQHQTKGIGQTRKDKHIRG